jgi:hypothetical protein
MQSSWAPFRLRAGSGQESLQFYGCDHIGVVGKPIFVEFQGIKGLETGSQDDGSDLQGFGYRLVFEIDGVCGTEFFARPTLSCLKIDTMIPVNGILERHCLGIWDIGGPSLSQPLVVGVIHLFRALFRTGPATDTLVEIHVSGLL